MNTTHAQTQAQAEALHANATIIDGLVIAKWNRALFEDMAKGGLTAANCTVSVWEGFKDTIDNITEFNQFFLDNNDLIIPVYTTADIAAAKALGKTGIILGFQNANAFEDKIGYVEVFKKLGVGIVQMAYNTQNLVGTGCYERDGGLSGFGREIVAEMNRVGIMCDLSHVGPQTSIEELCFIAEHGGFIGVTMFAPFLKNGINSTVDDYIEAIDYVINIAGEDCVGIGTDFTQGHDQEFFDMLTHDKGYARRLTDFGTIINPKGIRTLGEFPNLTATMLKHGWSESKIKKIMGENWVRILKDVWGE